MMAEESYLRWLGQSLIKIPTEIPRLLKKPITELFVGFYGLGYGLLGVLFNTFCSSLYPFLLTTLQWGSMLVVSFFLFTHGIYRAEKEAEG